MSEWRAAPFGDRDVAAAIARQAAGAWLAADWVPAWQGWEEDGDQLTVTVRLMRRPKPPAPAPPEPKRYCTECRWARCRFEVLWRPKNACQECVCPDLCKPDYVHGGVLPIIGCPANAEGECPHWEAKEAADGSA